MTSPDATPTAPAEPAPSAVWTRPRVRWRRAIRAASASLGAWAPILYFYGVRSGVLSWPVAIAVDVGVAALTGIFALEGVAARRQRAGARFGAMLDSTAVLPWLVGASVAGVTGLASGLALVPGTAITGLALAAGAVALWSWGFTAWWARRQPPSSS